MQYRIDGLGDGVEYARWTFHTTADGEVIFHGPRREEARLDVRRLYQLSPNHLHYASA